MTYIAQFRICGLPIQFTNAEIIIKPLLELDDVKDEYIGWAIKVATKLQPIVGQLYDHSDYGLGDLNTGYPISWYEFILKKWDKLADWHYAIESESQFKEYLRQARNIRDNKLAKENKTGTPGYVYLIQSPTGAYKIGRTVNPENRMATFSVKLPFEVEYVCVIKCENMHSLERELHNRFSQKRINGEWFNLAPEDVSYIKGLVK